jgi:hypothetical protein
MLGNIAEVPPQIPAEMYAWGLFTTFPTNKFPPLKFGLK